MEIETKLSSFINDSLWLERLSADRKIARRCTTSGYEHLDSVLQGGFCCGSLNILAARPAMGKTAFCMEIARRASDNSTVLVLSLEMSKEELFNRLICAESGTEMRRLHFNLSDDDVERIIKSSEKICKKSLHITDYPPEIYKLSEYVDCLKKKPDLLIVDYLQLLYLHGVYDKYTATSEISRMLKKIATSHNIAILALSQLSRAVEHRTVRRPVLSDLRESGSIEQDADTVMFLYRDDYYKRGRKPSVSYTELEIAKNRSGEVGVVYYNFTPKTQEFSELLPIGEEVK